MEEFVGGYIDWVRQRPTVATPEQLKKAAIPAPSPAPAKKKLSFREQTELAALPGQIDELEAERGALYAQMTDPAFLRDGAAVARARARLDAIDAEVAKFTARWEALETVGAEAERTV